LREYPFPKYSNTIANRGMTKLADNTSGYAARTYVQGDETALVLLFNKEQATLAGFVPRTVEYWHWCCLKRPDVSEEGILVLEKENKTVGYVVVGKSGNIWELCYDSSQKAKIIVSKLLTWAEDYARSVGCDSIVLNAYVKDPLVREVCKDMDFAESPPEPMFLSVLDMPQLMREVLQAKNQSLDLAEVFWFNLKNCPPWCVDSFGIMLSKNDIVILEKPNHFSKVTIDVEMSTLVALIFGAEGVFRALFSSKIRFDHFWNVFKVFRFIRLLQVKSDWFTPRADIG
jgi:hypothetical protein